MLNRLFAPVTACVRRHRGDVLKFCGDAVLVLWEFEEEGHEGEDPEGAAARRASVMRLAARCGRELLALALAAEAPPPAAGAPAGSTALAATQLQLHIACEAGPCTAMHLGGLKGRLEFMLTADWFGHLGPLLDSAGPGQMAVSAAVWAGLGGLGRGRSVELPSSATSAASEGAGADGGAAPVAWIVEEVELAPGDPRPLSGDDDDDVEEQKFRDVGSPKTDGGGSDSFSFVPSSSMGSLGGIALLEGRGLAAAAASVRAYIAPAVLQHHDAGGAAWLAENRHVRSALFCFFAFYCRCKAQGCYPATQHGLGAVETVSRHLQLPRSGGQRRRAGALRASLAPLASYSRPSYTARYLSSCPRWGGLTFRWRRPSCSGCRPPSTARTACSGSFCRCATNHRLAGSH